MKKLLILLTSFTMVASSSLSIISCSTKVTMAERINKIIGFRDIGVNYKFLSTWKTLMLNNSTKQNSTINYWYWELSYFANQWYREERLNLKSSYKPFQQKELTNSKFLDKIFLDFEFPYKNAPTTPFSGASVVTSTLGEETFIQIYNYKFLKEKGYTFNVEAIMDETTSSDETVSVLNSIPDENGAIYLKGTQKEGNNKLKISAVNKISNKKLETTILVSNDKNTSNSFIQWKTYEFIKYQQAFEGTLQEIVAHYLVQIHSQMMYNASYNQQPNIETKMPLLDSHMLNMLYCAANYGQYVNYVEYWPAGNIPISGFGLYYSFDFYVHPVYMENNLDFEELNSNPVVTLDKQLIEYAQTILHKYEELKEEK